MIEFGRFHGIFRKGKIFETKLFSTIALVVKVSVWLSVFVAMEAFCQVLTKNGAKEGSSP